MARSRAKDPDSVTFVKKKIHPSVNLFQKEKCPGKEDVW
jgi:hypothetical protein